MVLSDPQSEPGRIVASASRLRVGLGAAIVLVIVAVAVAVLASMLGSSGVDRSVAADALEPAGVVTPGTGADGPGADAAPTASVFVHLLGAVDSPGLYELRTGDRIVDAVAAAGGFTDDAEQGGVNLARQVSDGEQIYVPRVGEVPPGGVDSGALAAQAGGAPGAPSSGSVNLNTASREQLETLPGVGPVTAAAILDWRENNGRFAAVEDLLSVTGIGQKTFAALEDLVSV